MPTLPDWVASIPRPVCQVCGKDTHHEDDHLPMSSLLDGEPEDPRIARREFERDFGEPW